MIRKLCDAALARLSDRFDTLYADTGRPSIPPEKLLRALLLQAFYSVRSERQLMEQMNYNLLFRWFVGLSVDEPVWVPTVFSHNRDRLLAGDVAAEFMAAPLTLPQVEVLLSHKHFSVDGTQIKAWASMKSFRRRDGSDQDGGPGRNGARDFHGDKRSNDTHALTTDPDARLSRKAVGREAKLAYTGHLLMENRHGLVVDARLTLATGTAEPQAACNMVGDLPAGGQITLGADRAYDTAAFVARMRALGVTPHVAQKHQRASRLEHRRAHHAAHRLRREPGDPQADRGGQRLDQMRGGHETDEASRLGARWLDVSVQGSSLQLDPLAKADARRMSVSCVYPKTASAILRSPQNQRNSSKSGDLLVIRHGKRALTQSRCSSAAGFTRGQGDVHGGDRDGRAHTSGA